jgi:dienelactone hydrolase
MQHPTGTRAQSITIHDDSSVFHGDISVPDKAKGIVLFAHGSGSSRFSPRNQHVAAILQERKLATLLLDLLTREEDKIDEYTRQFRFDIGLLTRRLVTASDWVVNQDQLKELRIGYFGSSTGAAAAIQAAALRPHSTYAVVSRGGRPDLAEEALAQLKAPILLIVGGLDYDVVEMNRKSLKEIPAEKRLEIVPGATHLFEERGALDEVARLAANWFERYLN